MRVFHDRPFVRVNAGSLIAFCKSPSSIHLNVIRSRQTRPNGKASHGPSTDFVIANDIMNQRTLNATFTVHAPITGRQGDAIFLGEDASASTVNAHVTTRPTECLSRSNTPHGAPTVRVCSRQTSPLDYAGQGGREREGMCLGLVRKLAEGSEEGDGRRVSGDKAVSLNRAATSGGTWDGEGGVGVVVRTHLDLGPTALRLGFGLSQSFLRRP